jgi:hypothetical protein
MSRAVEPRPQLARAATFLAWASEEMANGDDFLAKTTELEGPFPDGKTGADFKAGAAAYRAQAAEYRRKAHDLSARPREASHPLPRQRQPRRQNVRTSGRRARAPASSDDSSEPPPDLAQVAAASARLWAKVRRREARLRLAA